MASPNNAVAIERALPQWAIRWPALRILEQTCGETLCDAPIVHVGRQVDVYQSVRCREPVPSRRQTTVTINYPLIPPQDIMVDRQVLVIGDLAAVFIFRSVPAISELDYV